MFEGLTRPSSLHAQHDTTGAVLKAAICHLSAKPFQLGCVLETHEWLETLSID